MSKRLFITTKPAQPLVAGRLTFLSLPGELRNKIYDLCLKKEYQRVPLNPFYLNKPDPYITLARTCSQVYVEVRGFLVTKQVAYIPVMVGMDYKYGGELDDEFGLTQETRDTIAAALMDFTNVQFHLHVDLEAGTDTYDHKLLMASLHDAIRKYQSQSSYLFTKHGLTRRRATVHLDHMLSFWSRFHRGTSLVRLDVLNDLVNLLAEDKFTDWEIRYYMPTSHQLALLSRSPAAKSPYLRSLIRDGTLAYLHRWVRKSGHASIAVFVEVFGEYTTWEYAEKTGSVVRLRTPATEFWPNVHFDPLRNDVTKNKHLVKTYPRFMPLEFFDDEMMDLE